MPKVRRAVPDYMALACQSLIGLNLHIPLLSPLFPLSWHPPLVPQRWRLMTLTWSTSCLRTSWTVVTGSTGVCWCAPPATSSTTEWNSPKTHTPSGSQVGTPQWPTVSKQLQCVVVLVCFDVLMLCGPSRSQGTLWTVD